MPKGTRLGRGPFYEVDTLFREHRDLRGTAQPRKRGRDEYHKYMKYSAVNRSQAKAAHYERPVSKEFWPIFPALLKKCTVHETLPKREFYMLARSAQRCRHHGRCPDKRWSQSEVIFKRGSKFAKEEAIKWMKLHNGIVLPWWFGARDEPLDACVCDLVQMDGYCWCPVEELEMNDIVASSGPCFRLVDKTLVADEIESSLSIFTDEWYELDSVCSWDDYVDVVGACFDDTSGDWTDVEKE